MHTLDGGEPGATVGTGASTVEVQIGLETASAESARKRSDFMVDELSMDLKVLCNGPKNRCWQQLSSNFQNVVAARTSCRWQ